MTQVIRKILPFTVFLAAHASPAIAQEAWEVVWEDNFEGSTLSSENWSYQTGNGSAYGLPSGWGNNERQYYTNLSSNLVVSDGTLKIIARDQSLGGADYTSARIRTLNKQEFLYGRFEARMKLPSTPGIWPAFWMLPTDSPYGGWASSGEIDILESVNYADRMYGTLHFGANWPQNQSAGPRLQDGRDFSDEFHVYSVDWDPDSFTWSIDGVPFGTLTSSQWYSANAPANPRAPFDSPFHILLNVAVGGDFPGNPNGASSFPQTLEVDYVRVSRRAQLPFGGVAHAIPGVIEGEDFDMGIEGQSYHDCDPVNQGGQYRDTGVDIELSSESGYNIGWMCPGEWLEYSVDVQQAGVYNLEARIASQSTGGSFRIERDGVDLTGAVTFGATGGWQSWQSAHASLELEAGEQVLRFVNLGGGDDEYNFNSMTFTAAPAPGCNDADLAEPFGVLNFFDVSVFLTAFSNAEPGGDINGDGVHNFFDVSAFLTQYNQGCP